MLLHIANKDTSSWSMRPWILMKVLGVPFEEREHDFLTDKNKQRRLWREFSPTSQVPLLIDGENTVWDSLAICLYVAERFPQALPNRDTARAWSYSAAAEMHSGFVALRTQCSFTTEFQTPVKAPDEALVADLQRLDTLWQQGLSCFGGPYLAGDKFTIADAFYAPVVLRLIYFGLAEQLSTASQNYVNLIRNLPQTNEWIDQANA